jgi:5'-3' exonuclease
MVKVKTKAAMLKPALLLDASITIFQYYFSMPDNWYSCEDYPTAAVYGYTTFLIRLLEQEQPKHIAACFDESLGTCFRNQIYPNYKVSRPPADDALAFQLRACREITELFNISSFVSSRYEADDLLGTLVRLLRRSKAPIAILTRDKDLGQLLRREQDYLWDYSKGETTNRLGVHAKFGVHPEQMIDYLALVGDSIDDIPGVPGLGPKTAQGLLGHFGGIDQLFRGLHQVAELPIRGASKLSDKLIEFRQQISMARQLATIVDDIDLDITRGDLEWSPIYIDNLQVKDFCQRMGFPRLYARIEKVVG